MTADLEARRGEIWLRAQPIAIRPRGERRFLKNHDCLAHSHLHPVIIRKGALGNVRRMLVSPQHGFLIDGRLVRAKHLAEFWGGKVARVDWKSESITYFHFLCDQHEIVFADGAASESLYPGPLALQAIGRAALTELLVLFPELVTGLKTHEVAAVETAYGYPARRYMTGGEARLSKAAQPTARKLAPIIPDIRPEFIPETKYTNDDLFITALR